MNGTQIWPVYICVEPLPFPDFEDTLSCRSQWTQSLGKAWFRAEELIAKFCPEAALKALLLGFVSNKISPEQKAVLLALPSQYNIAYNPLAVIGSQISKTVTERTIISPGVSWCQDTAFKLQEDGFISIENCGHVMIEEIKDAPELNRLCDGDICNFNQEPTLSMIWQRQKQVEDCIGMEQRFGIQTNQDYKNISDL